MKPFNNSLLKYFSFDIYSFDDISACTNFQRVNFVGEHKCYYMRLLTYMCYQF